MKWDHPISALVALVLSAWASFTFFRGSITGAPPLYSRGWFQRGLHLAAGIIFGSLAIGIALKFVGEMVTTPRSDFACSNRSSDPRCNEWNFPQASSSGVEDCISDGRGDDCDCGFAGAGCCHPGLIDQHNVDRRWLEIQIQAVIRLPIDRGNAFFVPGDAFS